MGGLFSALPTLGIQAQGLGQADAGKPDLNALLGGIMGQQPGGLTPGQLAPNQGQATGSKLGQLLAGIMGGGSSMGPAGANQPHQKLRDVISVLFGNQPRARTTAGMLGAQQPPGAGYWAYYPGAQQPGQATPYSYGYAPPAPKS